MRIVKVDVSMGSFMGYMTKGTIEVEIPDGYTPSMEKALIQIAYEEWVLDKNCGNYKVSE